MASCRAFSLRLSSSPICRTCEGENIRAIILAHHGYLTAGGSCEEATYLSVYLERAARMQIRAQAFGPLTPVDDALAREAHDYLLKPSIVRATFDYWARQTHGIAPLPLPQA